MPIVIANQVWRLPVRTADFENLADPISHADRTAVNVQMVADNGFHGQSPLCVDAFGCAQPTTHSDAREDRSVRTGGATCRLRLNSGRCYRRVAR